MKAGRVLRHAVHGPWGDASRHLPLEELERQLEKLAPPRDRGRLALIVARGDDGSRQTPQRARLTPEGGVPGDAWQRDSAGDLDSQLAVMREDVGRLIANGQPLTLFGDNLIVDLDLSVANLPAGSRLRVGDALVEVTPEPHDGCLKYRQRFGKDALRLTAQHRELRLRGVYWRVIGAGDAAVGDVIEVLRRGPEPAPA
jgi:hypothetical protein